MGGMAQSAGHSVTSRLAVAPIRSPPFVSPWRGSSVHQRIALFSLLAAGLAGCAAESDLQSWTRPAPTMPNPKSRHFEFTYETTVKEAPAGASQVDLWVPV